MKKKLEKKYHFYDLENSVLKCDRGNDISVVYLSNLLTYDIEHDEQIESKFFRHLSEFTDYLYSLNYNNFENIIYCHNLDYELSFLKNELNVEIDFESSIFRGTTSPIKIKFIGLDNIEFRCSYALLSNSVKGLGDKLGLPKLEYDYTVERTYYDELTQLDYDYNERDNLIVAKTISSKIKDGSFNVKKLPLTFTGEIKALERDFIKKEFGAKKLNKLAMDKKFSTFTKDLYELQVATYRGGLTGSNYKIVNQLLENVYSIDKKSDYPHQMIYRRFPRYVQGETYFLQGSEAEKMFSAFKQDNNHLDFGIEGYYGTFILTNVKNKVDDIIFPLTHVKDKTHFVGKTLSVNGKFLECEKCAISLNNVDMDTMKMVYDFEVECVKIYATGISRFLDVAETSFLLECFNKKENVVDKSSKEYSQSKSAINGMYGVKVQKVIMSEFIEEDGDIKEKCFSDIFDIEEKENKFNEYLNDIDKICGNNFNIYSDGVYITSYARHEIVKKMIDVNLHGGRVVYIDTDSVKFTVSDKKNVDRIKKWIDDTNLKVIEENKSLVRFKQYKDRFNVEDEKMNKILKLGIWEVETQDKYGKFTPYRYFKTLGAKKYCYVEDGKIKTTIAGCSKILGNFMTEYANKNSLQLGEVVDTIFKPNITFTSNVSGRTTAYRNHKDDENYHNIYYKGNQLYSKGGIRIESTTYKLDLSKEDKKTLYDLDILEIMFDEENVKSDVFNGEELIYAY